MGHSSATYIHLENISSVKTVYKSFVYYLVLGVCGVLYSGFNASSNDDMINGLAISSIAGALIMFALWWYSRKRIISIHSNGGQPIEFEVGKMREEEVTDFLEKVQLAMSARIQLLYKI